MSFVPSDFLINVARGRVSGAQPYSAYGKRTTSGAESNVLWPDGAYSFPASSGVQLSIVSTSVQDDAAGTGIRTMDIHYLDADLAEHVETVTLDGTTPVLTVATNIRFVQCMHGLTFGSGKAAAGNISASNGGSTFSYIATGDVRCSSSVRMVPAGKRIVVTSFYGGGVSGSAGAAVVVNMATPTYDGHDFVSLGIFVPVAAGAFQDGSSGLTIQCPFAFTAGQVIGMTFTTDKAATIVGSWFGWIENV